MTPRTNRLTKPEILSLWKKSRTVSDPTFRILFQTSVAGRLKWQVKVGAKANKKAAYRNRSRRLVDEVVKDAAESYLGKGINMLVIVKRDLHERKMFWVKEILAPLLDRAKST